MLSPTYIEYFVILFLGNLSVQNKFVLRKCATNKKKQNKTQFAPKKLFTTPKKIHVFSHRFKKAKKNEIHVLTQIETWTLGFFYLNWIKSLGGFEFPIHRIIKCDWNLFGYTLNIPTMWFGYILSHFQFQWILMTLKFRLIA